MKSKKSNVKKMSLCLSALILLILASPLTVLAAEEAAQPSVYGTFWSLVPPIVAIALALITKEVYSSLFIGILMGALLYSGFSFEGTVLHIFEDGLIWKSAFPEREKLFIRFIRKVILSDPERGFC